MHIHRINGHFKILNWRYLPYVRPMYKGISQQNMALYGTVPRCPVAPLPSPVPPSPLRIGEPFGSQLPGFSRTTFRSSGRRNLITISSGTVTSRPSEGKNHGKQLREHVVNPWKPMKFRHNAITHDWDYVTSSQIEVMPL